MQNHLAPPYFSILMRRILTLGIISTLACAWTPTARPRSSWHAAQSRTDINSALNVAVTEEIIASSAASQTVFDDFVSFLKTKQNEIIDQLEDLETSSRAKFSNDTWGIFADDAAETATSGGMTRVLQGGSVIEKGACSLTVIGKGILTAERASTIQARQQDGIHVLPGDLYSAAALSMVLHTVSPHVPTFRSDVRIFWVQAADGTCLAWFGGGADLTPYYLYEDDIQFFHQRYRHLCDSILKDSTFSYKSMKQACDNYFYLPARREHRGTGGIFFDDMVASDANLKFCQGVVDTWMPSWLPIVQKRKNMRYSDQQKQWQLLRRGRYLEFNLLYDRGVKFGLAHANPRVEGVMVSAPPVIAYEYNHQVDEGSQEAELMAVLKEPRDWI